MFGNQGADVNWSNASKEELENVPFIDLCSAFRQCNDILVKMRRDLLLGKEGVTKVDVDEMKNRVLLIIEQLNQFIGNIDENDIDSLESIKELLIREKNVIVDERRKDNLRIKNAQLVNEEESKFLILLNQVQDRIDNFILRNKDDIGLPKED